MTVLPQKARRGDSRPGPAGVGGQQRSLGRAAGSASHERPGAPLALLTPGRASTLQQGGVGWAALRSAGGAPGHTRSLRRCAHTHTGFSAAPRQLWGIPAQPLQPENSENSVSRRREAAPGAPPRPAAPPAWEEFEGDRGVARPEGSWRGERRQKPTSSGGEATAGRGGLRPCPQGEAGCREVRWGGDKRGRPPAAEVPQGFLDTGAVQSFNKPAQRGQAGAPQTSFRTRLTEWEGRARRARGPGRRRGHTTSYCST